MLLFVAAVVALSIRPAAAQLVMPDPPKPAVRHSITGTVMLDRKGGPDQRLEVTLAPSSGGGRVETYADSSGRFSFPNLLAGGYVITVSAPYGSKYEDAATQVTVFESSASVDYPVTITLKLRDAEAVPSAGTIAVDPDASVSDKARDLYTRGATAAGRGKSEEAISRFRDALKVAPDYRAALNDLGVQLLKVERPAEAVPVLRHATDLGPTTFAPRLNLALALLAMADLEAAESEISNALKIQEASTRALCVAGQISLARKRADEAIERLRKAVDAGDEMQGPAAFYLGKAYEATGDTADAVEAYRAVTYLEPATDRAGEAHARLKALGAE